MTHFNLPLTGFQELGRQVCSAQVIDISFTPKKFLQIVLYGVRSAAETFAIRFNGDSANNYSYRESVNGAADTTSTSSGAFVLSNSFSNAGLMYMFIRNDTTTEKHVLAQQEEGGGGGGVAPDREEFCGIWANTTTQIYRISTVSVGFTGTVIVLGTD